MVLARVIYEGEEKVVNELQEIVEDIEIKDFLIHIDEEVVNKRSIIDVRCDALQYTEDLKSNVLKAVSRRIYRFIIDIFIKKDMEYFFDNSYFFLKYNEIEEVKEKVVNVLLGKNIASEDDVFFKNKKKSIVSKINQCILENNEMNINGFIRFRMKELVEDIESIVDKVIEKYMVEREYNEFITLLKYFVEIQDSKIDEVHIIIDSNGKYTILDGSYNDVYDLFLDDLTDFNVSKMCANKDDLLISGLITNSPNKINIHGYENGLNFEIIETIKQVFDNKVSLCKGCSSCLGKININNSKS